MVNIYTLSIVFVLFSCSLSSVRRKNSTEIFPLWIVFGFIIAVLSMTGLLIEDIAAVLVSSMRSVLFFLASIF